MVILIISFGCVDKGCLNTGSYWQLSIVSLSVFSLCSLGAVIISLDPGLKGSLVDC